MSENNRREPSNTSDRAGKPDKKEQDILTLRFPLRAGRVTGLPKDPSSAPTTISLSLRFHTQNAEALERAKTSGKEWGYFIHLDAKGRLFASELQEGISQNEWITYKDYLTAQEKDPTIQGQMHAHLTNTPFSHNNVGFFLIGSDLLSICMNP